MPRQAPYTAALRRVRQILDFHISSTGAFVAASLEMEYAVRVAARAARLNGLSLETVRKQLTTLAADAVPERRSAEKAARILSDWAAREYTEV